MKRLPYFVRRLLYFSTAEKRGIFVLMAILFTLNLVYVYLPDIISTDPEMDEFIAQEIITWSEKKKKRKKKYTDSTYKHYNKPEIVVKQKSSKPKTIPIININTADSADFESIYGIHPWLAGRIIKYRKKLGGFYTQSQLLEVYGMDSSRYYSMDAILQISLDSIQKIDVNNASYGELIQHPYISKQLCLSILSFTREDSLKGIHDLNFYFNVTDSLLIKLDAYLEFK